VRTARSSGEVWVVRLRQRSATGAPLSSTGIAQCPIRHGDLAIGASPLFSARWRTAAVVGTQAW
jgi:hypothetical protein